MSELKGMRSVQEWCRIDGVKYSTMIKRRTVAGVGLLLNSKLWMLTRKEFDIVKSTPLPGCRRVM
jgi:hypothetical protein